MIIDKFYSWIRKVDSFNNHRLEVGTRLLLRLMLNIIYPFYIKIIPRGKSVPSLKLVEQDVIVTLTSFPARLKKLPLTLETIYRQSVMPTKVVLWLAEEQFPNKSEPERILKKYIEQGLEIKYCDDLKAHKKYFYTLKENPEALIITIDDDIFFPTNMINNLLLVHKEFPNCVICNRAHEMKIENGKPLPYNKWNYLAKGCIGPSMYLCATGGAGTLYPPRCLSSHVFDKNVMRDICFQADDIWLKCMEHIHGTKVVLTGRNNPEIMDVLGGKKQGLAKENVEQNLNDTQLNAVTEYYGIRWM